MGLEKINEYKEKLGITSEELAKKSGVPIGTLNKILCGQTKNPSLETVKAIVHALGLTLDDLDDSEKSSEDILLQMREEMRRRPDLATLYKMGKNMNPDKLKAWIELMDNQKENDD